MFSGFGDGGKKIQFVHYLKPKTLEKEKKFVDYYFITLLNLTGS
jgi:hypothetical protein